MGNRTTITILVDDRAGEGLQAEHGLSVFIDLGDTRILFDTGQGPALVENARHLNSPLEQVDQVVLSHGHYDHSGGLAEILALAPASTVAAHPQAMLPKYDIEPGKPASSIGVPQASREALDRLPATRVTWTEAPLHLASRVGVSGPIPRATAFESVGDPFFLDVCGEQADPVVDDQALWIDTDEGLVVLVGCSHAGLVNTLDYARVASGQTRIRAVIGGFHLLHADEQRIALTVEALRHMSPELIVPCHCTGPRATRALAKGLGGSVVPGHSGSVMRFT